MKKNFIYKYKDKEFKAVAEEGVFLYGKAVKIKIFNKDDEIRNRLLIANHIEFKEYDFYQNKSIEELIEIAIERLNKGVFDSTFEQAQNYNFEFLFRFNDSEYKSLNESTT